MTKHNSQTRFILGKRKHTLVHHDLTARHTECVSLTVSHQVKLPLEVLQLVGVSIFSQASLHGSSQALPHPLHKSRIILIRRKLSPLHIVLILLRAETKNLCIIHQQSGLTSRDRYRVSCSAGCGKQCQSGKEKFVNCFHIFIIFLQMYKKIPYTQNPM